MDILDKAPPLSVPTWPPAYNLRISKKAKHVHLKVLPKRGLEIVVPIRQQHRIQIDDLLIEKKSWIEKHLATLKIRPLELVKKIELSAINQSWHVLYQATTSGRLQHIISMGSEFNTITLFGDISNIKQTHICLEKWLKQLAKKHLLPWLQQLSVNHQLPFQKSGIRGQQTLWGSCTYEKNISLNYKLLFLPPKYAEHIMLHELCHTKFLNHSKRFWNLLYQLDPNSALHNQALREGDKYVPDWLS